MNTIWKGIKWVYNRYLIQAMGSMALGLFSTLIVGLIISQLGVILHADFLNDVATVVKGNMVVGGAIGAAVACGLKSRPLVIFSSVAVGAMGYELGGPVGSYLAVLVAAEIGRLVAGRTPVDIVVTPIVTILLGGLTATFVGPWMDGMMKALGAFINTATEMNPFPMGIIVSVVVGMVLTAPISSAALCIMLDLSGIAAGAATVGCCAQMVGFAVASFRDNGWGGLISQGLGTSMLQVPNILRRPQIWIAPTLASAFLGPVSTCWLKLVNNPSGAGMGTSGLVGPLGVWAEMQGTMDSTLLLVEIVVMCVAAPAMLTWALDLGVRRLGWVRPGDMSLKRDEA